MVLMVDGHKNQEQKIDEISSFTYSYTVFSRVGIFHNTGGYFFCIILNECRNLLRIAYPFLCRNKKNEKKICFCQVNFCIFSFR